MGKTRPNLINQILNDEIKKNKDKKIAIKIIKTSFEKNN
jgi:hypothetical protein